MKEDGDDDQTEKRGFNFFTPINSGSLWGVRQKLKGPTD
jgi:hypothetical protein